MDQSAGWRIVRAQIIECSTIGSIALHMLVEIVVISR